MRITVTIMKRRFTVEMKMDNFMVSVPGFQFAVYFAHTLSENGLFTRWKQRSEYYRTGFIARALWFGVCLRLGRNRIAPVFVPDYADTF